MRVITSKAAGPVSSGAELVVEGAAGRSGVTVGAGAEVWACDVHDIDASAQIPVALPSNLAILLFSTQFLHQF